MRVSRNFKIHTHANTLWETTWGNILREWPEFVIEIKTLNIVSYDQIAGKFPRLTKILLPLPPPPSVRPSKGGLITCLRCWQGDEEDSTVRGDDGRNVPQN